MRRHVPKKIEYMTHLYVPKMTVFKRNVPFPTSGNCLRIDMPQSVVILLSTPKKRGCALGRDNKTPPRNVHI